MFNFRLKTAGRLALAAGIAAAWALPAAAQTLNGAGATFPQPIYSKWIDTYQQTHPNVKINYQAVGSGAGIAQYKAGTVDFGATDAPLTSAEIAQLPRPTLHIPTVAGAVVMAYNIQGVGPGLHLSGDVIADIFRGQITKWNDPRIQNQNRGIALPAQAISVVHRADGSGTSYIFTNYLSAVSGAWRTEVGAGKSVNWPVGLGGKGNPGVAGIVRQSDGAIGYVELAYAIQNGLPYASVQNRAGNYVTPTVDSTMAAVSAAAPYMTRNVRVVIVNMGGVNPYPIVGFTYLLVPVSSPKNRALIDFLRWAMGPGQQMAPALYYAPLPPAIAQINLQAMAQMR